MRPDRKTDWEGYIRWYYESMPNLAEWLIVNQMTLKARDRGV